MALNVGDVCPQCKEGLLVRTEMGIACDECSFEQDIQEVVREHERAKTQISKEYRFRPARVSIRIATPEAGEDFLRGLIVARSNNSSPLFVELIDSINSLLEDSRAAKLRGELDARAEAGMR